MTINMSSQIKMYEQYVLEFLCGLHKQATDAERKGDVEAGKLLRQVTSRLMNEFEDWQKSVNVKQVRQCIKCDVDVDASRFYCNQCLSIHFPNT